LRAWLSIRTVIRRVRIEKLAPTGEGVARTDQGVGFVAGALPGEEVDAEVTSERKRFWFGRTAAILSASPARVSGPHASCPGCDWGHFDLSAALEEKPRLFLETMERIGELPAALFGEVSIAPSRPAYRIRSRFHAEGRGDAVALGFHRPGTHAIGPADACLALSDALRRRLPRIREAISADGRAVAEVATLETPDGERRLAAVSLDEAAPTGEQGLGAALSEIFEGVRILAPGGSVLEDVGPARLPIPVGKRTFEVSAGAFFQVNRFLVSRLAADVAAEAGAIPGGRALDAYGGVGLFAGALLDAGHRVVSVEGSLAAAEDAARTRGQWGIAADQWELVSSPVDRFVSASPVFDVVVVDPPRAGLGLRLARDIARLATRRFLYVSCDPATLARDLAVLRQEGFQITKAALYDVFAFTHRVEALVVLDRGRTA
jgi:tRNA/tmRNA/rRNA uracil-C5-methylase (TrmA/RlmC/RlmD family)